MLQRLQKKPLHHRFFCVFTSIFTVGFLIWNLTLIYESKKIWDPSTITIQQFVSANTAFSIQQYAKATQTTLFSQLDLDTSWLLLVKNSIVNFPISVLNEPQQAEYTEEPVSALNYSQMRSYLTQPNETIFSTQNYQNVDKILTAIMSNNLAKTFKRFNIIYINNNDQNDVMIKTTPADPDFFISEPKKIKERMAGTIQGSFMISTPLPDSFSRSDPNSLIFSHRSKIVMENYTIVLDLEVFPESTSTTFDQNMFQEEAESYILFIDPILNIAQVLSSSAPMNPQLNYTDFFQLGLHEQTLSNGDVMYIYSLMSHFIFELGIFHHPSEQAPFSSPFRFVTHTKGESRQLLSFFQNFKMNLGSSIQQFIIIWSIGFGLILLALIFIMKKYVKNVQKNFQQYIQEFLKNKCMKRAQMLQKTPDKIYWASHENLMRYTRRIVSTILYRIKKNNQTPQLTETEDYPKSIFEKEFQNKYELKDRRRIVYLRQKLIEEIIEKKQIPSFSSIDGK